MVVRELITRLGFSLNHSQLNNAEKGVARVKDRAEQAANAFRNVAAALASFATVKAIINIGDEMQSIRARIGQLPQTVGDAGDAFDEVAKKASDAGQSIGAYSSFYIKAGNATQDFIKDQNRLFEIVDGVAYGLAASGANAVAQEQAFFQLGQAIGSPVVQMEEMNTLIDVAPDLFRALGNAIPGANGNLKKLISTGTVTGKVLAEALASVAPAFSKKMSEIPMTVGRATVLIRNKFSVMIDKMNRDSNFVSILANRILAAFDKIEGGVYKLVEAFGGWNNMLRFVGIAIGVAFGAKAISILVAFRTVAWTAALPFLKIAAIIGLVTLLIEDLYVWVQGGDSLIGKMIGPWEEWRDVVMGSIEAVGAVFRWLGEYIAAVAATLVGLFTLDWNLFAEGIKGIAGLLWQVVGQWGIWIYDAFASGFSAVSSLTEQVFSYFESLALAVVQNIGKMIVGAFTLDPALFMSGLQGYTQALMDVVPEWAKTIYGAIFDTIYNAVTDAWASVKDIFGAVWEGAKNIAGASAVAGGSSPSNITPAQMSPSAMGETRPNINNSTQVNVTVPPGTTAEQSKFIQNAAQQSFSAASDNKLARDLAVYAP